MKLSSEDFAKRVIRHVVEIHGGSCSITPEAAIEEFGDQPELAQVLSGLAYLHEDLLYRDEERLRAEADLQQQNAELVRSRAQLAALASELSTPIIKVWGGVLLIPLFGSFDSERAIDMVDRLLSSVSRERARYVILDLTGVATVDTATADHFVRIIGSLRLLGAEGIIAGVQPPVAMSMVSLGVDISGVTTTRDAQEALEYCQRR